MKSSPISVAPNNRGVEISSLKGPGTLGGVPYNSILTSVPRIPGGYAKEISHGNFEIFTISNTFPGNSRPIHETGLEKMREISENLKKSF